MYGLMGVCVYMMCMYVCVIKVRPLKDRGGQVLIGLNVVKVRPLKDNGGQVLIGLNGYVAGRHPKMGSLGGGGDM